MFYRANGSPDFGSGDGVRGASACTYVKAGGPREVARQISSKNLDYTFRDHYALTGCNNSKELADDPQPQSPRNRFGRGPGIERGGGFGGIRGRRSRKKI